MTRQQTNHSVLPWLGRATAGLPLAALPLAALPLAALPLLGGCDDGEEPPPEFNSLPMVTLELRDGDPIEAGTTFSVAVTDDDGDTCSLVVEFSIDGGASYHEARLSASELDINAFACNTSSADYILVWDAEGDLGADRPGVVLIRVQPYDSVEGGPPRHLPVSLVAPGLRIEGPYVQRVGAQFPQWDYLRVGMAHVYLETEGMTLSGDYLRGDDELIVDGDNKRWSYQLPSPPPEEHFRSIDYNGNTARVAFYLPAAWGDVSPDGIVEPNGEYDAGWESLLGVSGRIVAGFFEPDGTWIDPGWHLVEIDVFADESIVILPDDSEIPMNLKGYTVNSATTDLPLIATVPGNSSMRRAGWLPPQDDAVLPSDIEELASMEFNNSNNVVAVEVQTSHQPASHWVIEPWGLFATSHATEMLFLYEDGDNNHEASGGEMLTHLAIEVDSNYVLTLVTLQGEMTWPDLWLWALDDCWKGMNLVTYEELAPDDWAWTCFSVDEPLEIEFVTEISQTDQPANP